MGTLWRTPTNPFFLFQNLSQSFLTTLISTESCQNTIIAAAYYSSYMSFYYNLLVFMLRFNKTGAYLRNGERENVFSLEYPAFSWFNLPHCSLLSG